jgi:hypothetical protein
VLLIGLTATLGACTFHRTTFNGHVKSLDLTAIEIGKTNRLEVLEILGPPSVPSDREIARPGPSQRFFRYYCAENKEVKFLFGHFIVLPFLWTDQQPIYDVMVEFDENGVVSDLHVAHRDTIWRPLAGESSREPEKVHQLGRRGQK